MHEVACPRGMGSGGTTVLVALVFGLITADLAAQPAGDAPPATRSASPSTRPRRRARRPDVNVELRLEIKL